MMNDGRQVDNRPWDEVAGPVPLADLEALRARVEPHTESIEEWTARLERQRLERRRSLIHELMADQGMDPARVLPLSHFFMSTPLAHDPTAPDGHVWWDEVIAIVPIGDQNLVAGGMPVEEVRRRYPHVIVPGGLEL